jgi:hypothetical protein
MLPASEREVGRLLPRAQQIMRGPATKDRQDEPTYGTMEGLSTTWHIDLLLVGSQLYMLFRIHKQSIFNYNYQAIRLGLFCTVVPHDRCDQGIML